MKVINIMVVFFWLILSLSACGVSKEDYQNKVNELQTARDSISKLEKQIKAQDSKIAELEKAKAEAKKQIVVLRKEFEGAKIQSQKMAGAVDKLQEYESIVNGLRSQNTSIQKLLGEKTESLGQLQGLLSQKEKSLGELQNLLGDKTSALSNLQNQMGKLRLTSMGDSSQLEMLKSRLGTKDAALKEKDSQLVSKDAALKQKDSQISALMKQLESLKKGGLPSLGGAGGLLKK